MRGGAARMAARDDCETCVMPAGIAGGIGGMETVGASGAFVGASTIVPSPTISLDAGSGEAASGGAATRGAATATDAGAGAGAGANCGASEPCGGAEAKPSGIPLIVPAAGGTDA